MKILGCLTLFHNVSECLRMSHAVSASLRQLFKWVEQIHLLHVARICWCAISIQKTFSTVTLAVSMVKLASYRSKNSY
jgi:hypothetical protein